MFFQHISSNAFNVVLQHFIVVPIVLDEAAKQLQTKYFTVLKATLLLVEWNMSAFARVPT